MSWSPQLAEDQYCPSSCRTTSINRIPMSLLLDAVRQKTFQVNLRHGFDLNTLNPTVRLDGISPVHKWPSTKTLNLLKSLEQPSMFIWRFIDWRLAVRAKLVFESRPFRTNSRVIKSQQGNWVIQKESWVCLNPNQGLSAFGWGWGLPPKAS